MLHQWLLRLALVSLPFWWGQTPVWELADAAPLSEVAGTDERTFNPALSPDGSAVAWEADDATCVYWFEDGRSQCFPWPDNAGLRSNRYNLATWSPDGRYIALSENFFLYFRDSDIWVLDTQTGAIVDRTDDGYFGGLMSSDKPDDLPLDYLPTWNPRTGDLYFFRSQEREPVLVDTGYTLQLYKMEAEGGEPELVRDLTLAIPGPFAVYRPVAFNDDGTKLAIIVLPQKWRESPAAGIWVLDLANGGTDLVANLPRLNAALPPWGEPNYLPQMVQWAGDDLVIMMEDSEFSAALTRTPVHLDMETQAVTPLVDYSPYSSRLEYINSWSETPTVSNSVLTGSLLPGGNAYWMVNVSPLGGNLGVFSLPLPGDEGEPALITELPSELGPGMENIPTMSADGKLLILHTLLTLAAAE